MICARYAPDMKGVRMKRANNLASFSDLSSLWLVPLCWHSAAGGPSWWLARSPLDCFASFASSSERFCPLSWCGFLVVLSYRSCCSRRKFCPRTAWHELYSSGILPVFFGGDCLYQAVTIGADFHYHARRCPALLRWILEQNVVSGLQRG